jgi:hypothetical protein
MFLVTLRYSVSFNLIFFVGGGFWFWERAGVYGFPFSIYSLSTLSLSFFLSVCLPFCLSAFLSDCLSVILSFCLSVCLSFCLSVFHLANYLLFFSLLKRFAGHENVLGDPLIFGKFGFCLEGVLILGKGRCLCFIFCLSFCLSSILPIVFAFRVYLIDLIDMKMFLVSLDFVLRGCKFQERAGAYVFFCLYFTLPFSF